MTKFKSAIRNPQSAITWILFAFVIVAVYFFALDIPLLGPDEPRYSQVAREMFERNDWVTPTLGGFDWFEKPALLYWLQIASYKLFGVSEFAARFGSAIFGLGTIFALLVLGKTVQSPKSGVLSSEQNQTLNFEIQTLNSFANWLALIAASSLGLLVFSRGASFDIILTFPITASLVAFFIAHLKEKNGGFIFYFCLFTFYFFIGIALIAKGLVGIVFPFAIVTFYFVLIRGLPSKSFIFSLLWGTILSLIVASAWYLPMYQANGWKFIDEFFIQHHFQRYTSNKYLHPQPFWFFFLVLPAMTIPWLPFFLASVWKQIKNQIADFKEKSAIRKPQSKIALFAFAWMLVPLVFFSLSGSKLPGYILPALPAAIILTALYVYDFVQKSETRRIFLQVLAFLMFAFTAVALQFFVDDFAPHETEKFLLQKAAERDFADRKVLTLHNISHNLEFYAPNRLVRLPDGKQRYFYGTGEVKQFIEQTGGKPILVLVPLEYLKDLSETDLVKSDKIGDNGEKALFAVELKK